MNNKNSDIFITKKLPLKESLTFSSHNSHKNTMSVEEVKRKIEDFKYRLNLELTKLIQEEKEKEDERMRKYNEETDELIKKVLEEAISKERNESSKRVFSFNE